jgi:hypothetical protein
MEEFVFVCPKHKHRLQKGAYLRSDPAVPRSFPPSTTPESLRIPETEPLLPGSFGSHYPALAGLSFPQITTRPELSLVLSYISVN